MSRIAKNPITIPAGVEFKIEEDKAWAKGAKGELTIPRLPGITVEIDDGVITVKPSDPQDRNGWAMAGTQRALLDNLLNGVASGFQKKLQLVGVGYRAQMKGKVLNLALGFSHPVEYPVPDGISIETPSQTEIVVSGADKQQVGQVAAEIRRYRPPEPYKGKGVRYADEQVVRKEAKKK